MKYFFRAFEKYAVFSGRASRSEYWYFFLFNIIFAILLGLILGLITQDEEVINNITTLYQLAVLLPTLGVGVRRIHDTNKSGWFILIPIYNLILLISEGTKGDNKYGKSPIEIK
jgi:uncharacterized membrane protein YhaH (DUF805 family)